jgi:hypothetical protein
MPYQRRGNPGILAAMSITITLPPSTEARLWAEATATGKDVDTVIAEAVEARLSLARFGLRDILAPVHEDFRTNGMTEAELETLLQEVIGESRKERKAADPASSCATLTICPI